MNLYYFMIKRFHYILITTKFIITKVFNLVIIIGLLLEKC